MGKGQGMKQLSGLDASFLYLETPEMPMHVGALHVFELEKGFRGDFVRRMREHLRTRLPIRRITPLVKPVASAQ